MYQQWWCTGLWDTSRDILFWWWELISQVRQHLEKTKFKPAWMIPRRNQYTKDHQPRWGMSCTHTNCLRQAACNMWLTLTDDDYYNLSMLAKEDHGYSFDTGNTFSSGAVATKKFLDKQIENIYFNVWFNSDDFKFLVDNGFALSIGYNVTTKQKADVMDNNRIDTTNWWARQGGHITVYYKGKVHDSNMWSPYEEYEIPEKLWNDLRSYGDIYHSAFIHLPVEKIYKVPWSTSIALHKMASRLSYRYGKKFNDMQNQNYYHAEASILEDHLSYDHDNILKLAYDRIVMLSQMKEYGQDILNAHLTYINEKIQQFLSTVVI